MNSWLEWAGCATGLLDSALLALNLPLSRWGILSDFISNLAWLGYGLLAAVPARVLMQLGLLLTTLMGFYRWFRLPARAGDADPTARS